MPSAFISHASPNAAWARWMRAELEAVGIRVRLDSAHWKLGDTIVERVDAELAKVDMFLALVDRECFAPGRWTHDELSAAATAARTSRLSLLPIRIGQVQLTPYYDRLLRLDLFDKPEADARRALRAELSKVAGHDLNQRPLPSPMVPFPGPVYVARKTELVLAPETMSLKEQASLDSREFLKRHSVSTSGENIDAYMDRTMMLGLAYAKTDPQTILKSTQELRKSVTKDLERTTAPGAAMDLYLILGKILGILSYASLDLGEVVSSLDHVNAVIYCGRIARHDDLPAWGLGTKAMILRFQARLDRSLKAVNAGLELKVHGSARARLLAQAALDWSELRDSARTIEALREADDLVDLPSGSASDMSDGIFLFPRAKYHYYAGAGYLGLDAVHAGKAAHDSAHAIERFRNGTPDEQSYSDELLACIHLATANLKAQELDAIPINLAPLLNAEPQYRTAWHVQFLDRLVTALTRDPRYRSSSLTAELSAAAQDFTRGYVAIGQQLVQETEEAIEVGEEPGEK